MGMMSGSQTRNYSKDAEGVSLLRDCHCVIDTSVHGLSDKVALEF